MKKKKLIWLVAIMCGVVLCFATIQVIVHADESSPGEMAGQCGDSIIWELFDNGAVNVVNVIKKYDALP